MRSRARGAGAIVWLLTAGAALVAPVAAAQAVDPWPPSRFVEQRERFTPDGGAPIDLTFQIAREAAGQTARVVKVTHAALTMLPRWFGPLSPSLTITGVPWRGRFIAESTEGAVSVPLRWLTLVRDQSAERALIAALVRQYWNRPSLQTAPFEEALVIYTGTRAIHELLEGSNFATLRFFGGTLPFPLRSVLWSPPVADPRPRFWGFDELAPTPRSAAEVTRAVQALQTLERYIGWPTMIEVISRVRVATTSPPDAATFATVLSEVRGTDMRSLVTECFRSDAVFDYVLDDLQSRPGPSGLVETTVSISRTGSGQFAIRDAAGDRESTVPFLIRFADGTEAREFFDGAASSTTLVYSTPAAAVSATIDPDVMLIVDSNRDNNTVVRDAPIAPLGVRLALHWMAWLQNAMLSYTAML